MKEIIKKVNPFMLMISLLQIGATIYEYCRGNKMMAGVYACYSISSVLLSIIAMNAARADVH